MQPTSSALITSDAVILGLLMATLGLVFYTSSHPHPKLRAFYKYVPSLLLWDVARKSAPMCAKFTSSKPTLCAASTKTATFRLRAACVTS